MIKALCNKCILLDHGQLVKYGPTEEIIEAYISQKQTTDFICHVEFEEDQQKESAQVYRICIKNQSGNEASSYEIFEPIQLEVEYEIKKPLIGVALGFSIYKNQGAVCHSFDTDVNSNLLDKREPGKYIATVEIPPILMAGNYVLDFTICRPGLDGIDFKKGIITFCVEEKTIDTSMCSYSNRRDGQFAARQEWSYIKL